MAAPAMTYDSLVADVIKYSERNDPGFIEQIPRLIMMAEQEIAAQVKTLWQLTVVTTTLVPGSEGSVLQKPARWRKTVSMKVNGSPVVLRSQDYVAEYQSQSDPGQPIYYSDYDYNNWMFGPVPDQEYTVEIIYYSRIQPLDQTNQENLITREAPQAILFGTLLQAQGYLKNVDKLGVWQGMYQASLGALKAENASRNIDRNVTVQEP
jgi:hypothetical protein